jgi:hypothetical protein
LACNILIASSKPFSPPSNAEWVWACPSAVPSLNCIMGISGPKAAMFPEPRFALPCPCLHREPAVKKANHLRRNACLLGWRPSPQVRTWACPRPYSWERGLASSCPLVSPAVLEIGSSTVYDFSRKPIQVFSLAGTMPALTTVRAIHARNSKVGPPRGCSLLCMSLFVAAVSHFRGVLQRAQRAEAHFGEESHRGSHCPASQH